MSRSEAGGARPALGMEPARAAVEVTQDEGRPTPASQRKALARHLGVSPPALEGVADLDVATALERMGALVDRLAELEARAVHDDLTGVLRRGAGLEALRLELARTRRSAQPLSVVFLDVDGLKAMNDSRGHAAGDALLCEVASTLRRRLRSTDLIIRLGGDEFLCVLPGSRPPDALRVMAGVAGEVARSTGGSGVSVGVAGVEPQAGGAHAEDTEPYALIAAADLDLYARRRERSGR